MWDDAFPSFLIGLREGLEGGLIVSILIATLVRAEARSRLPQVWTGVLAAIAVAMSFGAVLTFTAASLSATAQEAFGGTLSVIAVAFVTAMVFWMRRSARSLSGELREKVTGALAMGSGMLVLTSFLAVGREGLETALFLWTTARAAGESAGPLTGAAIGLVLAGGLCWGLYRRVLKINLTRFFTATGAVLIVIAAGVLGYGLRDLQEGGVLPGGTAYAVDLTGSVDAGSWYSTLVQGVFNLTPAMSWLQVVAYAAYLVVVMTLFVRGVRATAPAAPAAKPAATAGVSDAETAEPAVSASEPAAMTAEPAVSGVDSAVTAAESATTGESDTVEPVPVSPALVAASAAAEAGPDASAAPAQPVVDVSAAGRESDAAPVVRRRPGWVIPVAVVAVPAVLAGLVVALARPKPAGDQTVAVSETECGKGFTAPEPGRQTFQMHNTGGKTSEVYLIDPSTGAVYGEIEGLAPGTTRDLVATVAGGTYAWRCVPTDGKAVTSKAVRVSGGGAAKPVVPVSEQDLAAPLKAYKTYVEQGLATLVTQTRALDDDIEGGHLDRARTDWLTAHRTYASLGAAYGTFEDFDQTIDGRPDGLPNGVQDKDFTGFLRLERGLWHGESAKDLRAPAGQLADAAAGLRKAFPAQDFDPGDLPLRAHEILENTLQFELTGDTDQGSGTNLATADANLAGTRELLTVLQPLLTGRAPKLLPTVDADIARLQKLLDAAHDGTHWTPVDQLAATDRQRLNGATGQLLEDLAPVPDLLEIRKSA
ncbi:iron uptake transporter permease EfeU [Streptomyces diastatochromogenes]|uniref:Iron permease n=1 Tax=Streptomyces diastatochromogenes TaxID=42236 RepID=A0A233S5W8_STRDA|nr:iron uptake transporter permease EfeU [Streptomyces diastatochromogenes]OXY90973.1 iron permease [Streptomyces diastatochromogenes]